LKKVFGQYGISPKNLSLLTWQLYEVFEGCRQYINEYEALFGAEKNQERLLDILSGIDVLLEDVQRHSAELKRQIKEFLDATEPDP